MKFARYLSENLTVEWRAGYIDYRALKKAIKKAANLRPGSRSLFQGDDSDDSADEHQAHAATSAQELARQVQEGLRMSSGEERQARSRANSVERTATEGPSEPVASKGYGSMGLSPRAGTRLAGGSKTRDPSLLKLPEESTIEDVESISSPRPALNDPSSPPTTRLTPQEILSIVEDSSQTSPAPQSAPPTPSSLRRPSSFHRSLSSPRIAPETLRFAPGTKDDGYPGPGSPSGPSSLPLSPRMASSSRPAPPSPLSLRPGSLKTVAQSFKASPAAPILGSDSPTGPPRTGALAVLGKKRTSSGSARNSVAKAPEHLSEVLPSLLPPELQFVELLDSELDKVESFYRDRLREMSSRVTTLRGQMADLAEHRRIFHQTHPNGTHADTYRKALEPLRSVILSLPNPLGQDTKRDKGAADVPNPAHQPGGEIYLSDPKDAAYDPDAYKRYKRRLRAATLECYRGCELLKNFRILNMTGFRKALKKMEKASGVHLIEAYTNDKISLTMLCSSESVDDLLEELETLYAARFEGGNQKKARERLRVTGASASHHFSTFRSGLYVGLGMPALIHAIILSFEPQVRGEIASWDALLQVYGALFLPVIFALLFFTNLQAWAHVRVNVRFIFELQISTAMDWHQFAELPAFMFATLSFCFWFSFYRVGAEHVAPTTWPLAWLVFFVLVLVNPLQVMYRSSRWWFLRTLWKVVTPGYAQVAFAAFFLADELNSLIYSVRLACVLFLYNIWFLGCAQSVDWIDVYSHCNQYDSWVVVLISIAPPLARLLQCLQRWKGSGLRIHLINAGKYLSTIITFICFYLWRSRGAGERDITLPFWVLSAVTTSVYSASWDLLIDWSLLQKDAGYLRSELLFRDVRPLYYVAMVLNVLLRFAWLGYLRPHHGLDLRVRAFILYTLEMLRRCMWNVFRVENEQLGNVDQYRVTREIPLPYTLHGLHDADSSDDEAGGGGRSSKDGGATVSSRAKGSGSVSLRLSRVVSSRSRRSDGGDAPRGDGDSAV